MMLHRKEMSILTNLHDFCCRGTKNYRESLSKVKDFNLAKIITLKCVLPHISGVVRNSVYSIDTLYAVQMDIELFNYVDYLFQRGGHPSSDLHFPIHPSKVFLTVANKDFKYRRNNIDFTDNFYVDVVARSFTKIEHYIREHNQT